MTNTDIEISGIRNWLKDCLYWIGFSTGHTIARINDPFFQELKENDLLFNMNVWYGYMRLRISFSEKHVNRLELGDRLEYKWKWKGLFNDEYALHPSIAQNLVISFFPGIILGSHWGKCSARISKFCNQLNGEGIVSAVVDENLVCDYCQDELQSAEKRSNRAGFVYLLDSGKGFYKIGRSKDPKRRTKSLKITGPFRLELVHTILSDDCVTLENELHHRYAKYRAQGEFFELPKSAVEEIFLR